MRCLLLLAILSCLSVAPASAQPSVPSSNQGSGNVDVTSAEKLSLRFPGNPEMTGDYRIGADNTISVPILGRIPIEGMSPAQLEELLAKRLEQITGRANSVTVEVATYKPVFVTGFVNRSGAVPWQPDMTVLQAVALSGGLFRPTAQSAGGPAAAETEMAKFRRAMEDRKRALAALARLQAERQGEKEIQVPQTLIAIAGPKEAQEMIAAQKSLLASRQTSLSNQLTSLERGMELAKQELNGLREQSERIAEQLEMRRESRERLGALQKKGIVVAQRAFEEDIKVSELEEKTATAAVATARVQATVAELQREAVVLTEERKASIDTEIQRLQREASQLEDEAATARQAYSLIAGAALKSEHEDKTEIVYSVVRREGAEEMTTEAGPSTPLKPGDVLVVSQEVKTN